MKAVAFAVANVAVAVVVVAGAACHRVTPVARAAKVAGSSVPIGVNLAGLDDWSVSYPFADAFKLTRDWTSGSVMEFDDHRPVAVDEHGWVTTLAPGQIARALVFTGVPHVPKGKYVVTYKGTGKLDYNPTPLGPAKVESSPGQDVVDVDGGPITINITETDPKDPLRDIHMWMPGTKPGDLFHPQFLADHKGFGTLRFMDWQKTNDSKVTSERDRPHVDDARYTVNGAPYEIVVAASEALDADPWVNVPHAAGDDYVRGLATYLRDHVRKDRRIYVELSNEVWNDLFPQSRWAASEADRRHIGGDAYEKKLRAYSERVVEVMRIFDEVFAADNNRLVRVMGAQAANPHVADVELAHKDAYKSVDAVAIAPYIGATLGVPENAAAAAAKSSAELLDLLGTRDIDEVTQWTKAHKKLADKYSVRLLAYEGGTHTMALGPAMDDPKLNALFDDVNRAPEVKGVYLKYFAAWKEAGGELFMHFQDTSRPSRYGRWGLREEPGQSRAEAPKLDAVMTFNESTARWWQ